MNLIKIKLLGLAMMLLLCGNNDAKSVDTNIGERIGVCTSVKNAQYVKEAGGGYVEVAISSFLIPEESDELFGKNAETAKNCGLPVTSANGFFPANIKLVGEEVDMERIIKYTEIAMKRAAELGIKTVVLGSGKARRIPEGVSREKAFRQFVDLCKKMASIAHQYDITIVIEPLQKSETNFINSVMEGVEVVKAVKHPNLCVLADLFHMMREEEGPQSIIRAKKYLKHVHIAEKANRTAPGVEGDDFTPYFKALKKIKYQGNISLECGWNDFPKQVGAAIGEVKRQLRQIYECK